MTTLAQTSDVRDRLLDATDRLLARYGYRKMTIEDLAREVGIGKGSVYLHFPSKEALVLAHIDRIVARVVAELQRIAASDAPPRDQIRDMLLARVLIRFDAVQHYSESIDELLGVLRKKVIERRKTYFAEEARVLATAIRAGQAQGTFRSGKPLGLAAALVTATNALLPASLSTQELGERAEVRRKALAVAELMLGGLKIS